MEIKNEANVEVNYEMKEKVKKKMSPLKKWGIVGATIVVTGITALALYMNYYNDMTTEVGGINIETLGIQAYNAQFETYFSSGRNRTKVLSLISKVIANNEYEDYPKISVTLDGFKTKSGDTIDYPRAKTIDDLNIVKTKISSMMNRSKFSVSGLYDNEGCLEEIIIKEYEEPKPSGG